MTFDQEQSPRLGQTVAPETPAIRMFSGVEIPEAAWIGQMIYRTDTQMLQVYNGDAWEDVVGGVAGLLTYVGPDQPVTGNAGDLWYDSDDGHKLYRHDGTVWVSLAMGSGALADGAVTAPKILDGSVRAQALEANMVLTNRIDIGQVDAMGLDPDQLAPNLLPPLLDSDTGLGAITAGKWWPHASAGTWSLSAQEFNLEAADPLWQRLHSGVFPGFQLKNTGSAITGSTTTNVVLETVVTVEAETEYRLSLGSAYPGSTSVSSAVVADAHVNAVKVSLSTSSTFAVGGVTSWKSNSIDLTPNPEFVQWDDLLIKTATGQTSLYIQIKVDAHYIAAQGSAWVIDPTLRKATATKTLEAITSGQTINVVASAVPTATNTQWQCSASWASGTPTTTGGSYTAAAGAFSPALFSTPGRYQRPDQATFMSTRGHRVTSQSSAAATATLAACTPTIPIPIPSATGQNISHYFEVGFGYVSIATNYAVEAYFFDVADALIGSAVTIGTGAPSAWGINNLTEHLFAFRIDSGDLGVIPDNAVKVGFRVVCTTSAGVAATNYSFGMHSVRFYALVDVNPNYGQVEPRHITQDPAGIRLTNELGQLQVNIPTDSASNPMFKGEVEADGLRVLGGATFESAENEIAKDSILWLSDGIKSPTSVPTLIQEYEQYTIGRTPPAGQHPGFSTIPTLNPAQITGMCWKSEWNEIWIMENRGGGSALWRFSSGGTCKWVGLQNGWQNTVPYEDTRTTPGVNDSLYAGEFGGIHWAIVYNGTDNIFNKFPAGAIPDGVEPAYTWNQTNNKLYVWYPHIDGSGRNVYKRFGVNNTPNGELNLEETVVGGSGTSRTSSGTGLAGAVISGSTIYTAARATASADVYAFATGSGGALNAGARFPLAAAPMGFCHDGTTFWQVDSSGKFTRYSTWTWTETNHKLYAGMTWYDSDAGGTGTHETNLTTMASVTLKKRISGIRATLPQVPDKGGSDDPNKWRFYAFKGTTLSLPAGRTSLWLQGEGGSSSAQTTYVIPANGLVTSGTNPPAANNFPGAGAGKWQSTASDGDGPLASADGAANVRFGNFKMVGSSGKMNVGRQQIWATTAANACSNSTFTFHDGGWTNILGDHTANDGWTGIIYSGLGVWTVQETGWYWVEFAYHWDTGINRRLLFMYVNETTPGTGNAYKRRSDLVGHAAGTGLTSVSQTFLSQLQTTVYLTVGQTLKFGMFQTSGGTLGAGTGGIRINGSDWAQALHIERRG